MGGVIPFTHRSLGTLNAFFPSLDAIVFVTDLVTATLLFAQFSISRSRSILILANGYLFTAFIVVPHALTFSGAFSPTGLLGANNQTGSWLFIFWHFGFAAALLGYALPVEMRDAKIASPGPITRAPIVWSVTIVLGLVCVLTWLSTRGATFLPAIVLDDNRISPFVVYPIWLTVFVSAAALITILSGRRRSLLDQWLVVVAFVHIAELALSGLIPSVRFSAGFYAGRVFSLIIASVVLIILLAETTRLYLRLARSNEMLERERRNKLLNLEAMVASIAHEVRQPLGAIVSNGEAARLLLNRHPPEIAGVQESVEEMIGDAHRANKTFENMRNLFKTANTAKEQIDINDLITNVLRLFQSAFEQHDIEVSVELDSALPTVKADKGQLQEVLINLIQNAIEALVAVDPPRYLKIKSEMDASGNVSVAVEDGGRGLSPDETDTMFEPFVTTKPHGMGLGLAICRRVLERHGGQLLAAPADSARSRLSNHFASVT